MWLESGFSTVQPHALGAASDDRKARLAKLKSLKRKQPTDEADVARLHLSGRNYDPEARGPKLGFESAPDHGDQPTLEELAADVADEVERKAAEDAQEANRGIDLFKLQPKKPNWDLKRDLEKKLEVLNVRTDNAIARLQVGDEEADGGDAAGMDGAALVEGLRPKERKEGEELAKMSSTSKPAGNLGSWLANGSYQDTISRLCASDPRLRQRDPKTTNLHVPFTDEHARVSVLEAHADDGTFRTRACYTTPEALQAHLSSAEACSSPPGRKAVYILEGMGPGFVGVVGAHFRCTRPCLVICDPPLRRVHAGENYTDAFDVKTYPYQGGYIDFVPEEEQLRTHHRLIETLPGHAIEHVRSALIAVQRGLTRKQDLARMPMRKDPAEARPDPSWLDCEADFLFLLRRLRELRHRTASLNAAVTGLAGITGNRLSYKEQQRTIREAKSTKAITLIGLIFIPLAYTSSVFSMTEPYAPGQELFWVYFAASAPLIVLVVLGYYVLDYGYRAGSAGWSIHHVSRRVRKAVGLSYKTDKREDMFEA
ncbi:unnamed protein product [Parascedosporium putredinis]|uniref:Uncharacterized protein n=1 Tax=Parascedosporium putredinis TaxID=1442378 RepID=A0A9P1GXQ9_9PEZI|nr:unnamed protein product [Parascedosporium putredinis]CAI7990069.1 unnamed protein product [Parascedosporium putredinis]